MGTADLVRLLQSLVPRDGTFEQGESGVFCTRRSESGLGTRLGLHRASVCIVAQGAKRVLLGQDAFEYDEANLIVSSVDVPVTTQVLRASPDTPYLGVRINLDPQKLAQTVPRVFLRGIPSQPTAPALATTPVDDPLRDAVCRLLAALSHREHSHLLAPLAYEEVLIRLLLGPLGPRIAQVCVPDSGLFGVFRVVSWLRVHYAQPVTVEDLAKMANMSVSSFHRHFRAVTTHSPLQYQKALRLQEARNLMLSGPLDASQTAQQVGYVSASQFSREYSRYFGRSPSRDIAQLRRVK